VLATRGAFFSDPTSATPDAGDVQNKVTDLAPVELSAVLPLLAVCLALAIYPAPFFRLVQGGVSDLNQLVNPPGPDEIALADVETAGVRQDPAPYSRVEHPLRAGD
jgi:NADH:ubiquinone oxidoreductase subunit 4 (subunit M)